MKKLIIGLLALTTITANAARVIDGINYEFDRDKKVAYVIKADDSAPYTGKIVIPEKVKVGTNEFTVVAIQKSAFIDNDEITSLSLPESIVEVQEFAFRGCTKLTSLYLPDGLIKIGQSAFGYCRGLEVLRLPDNSEIELGVDAFSHLDNLRKLTIPDSWTSLGVKGRSAGYFQDSGFSELRIGKNIKYIGYGVFSGCSNLTTIVCSDDCALEEIGSRAFAGCSSLLNLKFLPKSLKIIGESAFTGCSNLREVSIPNSVETIKSGSWLYLYTGKLIINDGTTPFIVDGSNAGSSLFGPVNVYLGRPIDAKKSRTGLLFSTGELKRIDFGPYFEGGSEWKFGKNVRLIYSCVTDPTKITCEFEDDVYDNATLYVPVGTMDAYMAQENFSKFFDVREFYAEGYLGNSSWYIDFDDIIAKNICLNNWDTDYDCELAPKEIEAVTDIGDAFRGSYMTTFNEFKYFTGLKTIPERAFSGCSSLESIEMPYTITSIGDYAFSNCRKLKIANIGYNVSCIGEYAFSYCQDMTKAIIPASVKKIGAYAFYSSNTSLVKVICLPKQLPETDPRAFGYALMSNTELEVQEGYIDIYKNAEPWKYFKNICAFGSIDAGDVTIKVGSSKATTFVCDDALDFTDNEHLTAYIVTGMEGNSFWLSRIKKVPAKTPIYVKADAEGSYTVNKTTLPNAYFKNFLIGNNTDAAISVTPEGTDQYFFLGSKGFTPFTSTRNVGAQKAYVRFSALPTAKAGSGWPLTIGKAKMTTVCADVDLDFSDQTEITAYTVIGYENGSLWIEPVERVSAGTPLYVKGPQGSYTITSNAVQTRYANMLVGNNTDAAVTIQPTDGEFSNFYVGSGGFTPVSAARTTGAHKSYLQILTSYIPAATRGTGDSITLNEFVVDVTRSIIGDDDNATGISRVAAEAGNDTWYNLNGQRIDTPTKKGLYIKNGKKVIVK